MRRNANREVQGRGLEHRGLVNEAAREIQHVPLMQDKLPHVISQRHIRVVSAKREREAVLVDLPPLRARELDDENVLIVVVGVELLRVRWREEQVAIDPVVQSLF